MVGDVLRELEALRADEESFTPLFTAAERAAEVCDIALTQPRTVGVRQWMRARAAAGESSVQEYYRAQVYVPALDHVIEDLKLRFGERQK